MTPRTIDPDRVAEVEDRIIEAARDLLAQGGLDHLSMRHVADRVGMSATALYHYFDNKEALVDRVLDRAFRRFGKYLETAASVHAKGSLDRLHALGEGYLRFAIEHQAYFRVLFSIHREDPRRLDELPEGGGYRVLRQAVVDAIEAGNLRNAQPDVVALYLWSLAHGVMTIALACNIDECQEARTAGRPGTPVDLFHAFRSFVRDGIAASVAQESAAGPEGAAA